jgi:hypothetical protein
MSDQCITGKGLQASYTIGRLRSNPMGHSPLRVPAYSSGTHANCMTQKKAKVAFCISVPTGLSKNEMVGLGESTDQIVLNLT